MKLTIFCRGALLLVFLTACSGLFPAPILSPVGTPTPTPVSTAVTPTTTIVWFPPTNTPPPFPTQTILSTPDQRPGLGDLLFTDSFDQPDLWNTSVASSVSATVARNRLLLSISSQGPVSILSLRSQPSLGDFYAEVAVQLSLCGEKDQFGMIFRDAPGDNYYRFVVSCDGQVRLERSLSGSRAPMLDWLPSGDAPTAAPVDVKLGVWVVGGEMRFFLNDHYQFSTHDPVLHTGTLGFFVYASGEAPITASFSNLAVYSVSYASPTPSPIPSRTPTP